jgi:transketolase
MLASSDKKTLLKKAYNNRIKILKMSKNCSVHLGGALSCIDILTVLYNKILKLDPENPKWEERDRFILSAGHKGVALYTTLQDIGFFKEELLWKYGLLNSGIGDHPDEKSLPGIEFPTGSLGHGLSAGSGMAIAAKIDKKNYRIFVLLGDGECEEGSVWEAAMAASHHRLDNLIAIVDRNGLQVNGRTTEVMNSAVLEEKFDSFGWKVKTINGHDYSQIYNSLVDVPYSKAKPTCIIADTVKSKGVTFAENDFLTHNCRWVDVKIDEAIDIVRENLKKELSSVE